MWIFKYLRSSIGRKQMMGITGLVWYSFLFIHLFGNLGLLAGPERFNAYSYLLTHTLGEIIIPTELFFLTCLVTHIFLSITLKLEYWQARPVKYRVNASAAKGKQVEGGRSFSSMNMIWLGLGLLLFLTLHISRFKFGLGVPHLTMMYNGEEITDLYTTVLRTLAQPAYAGGYIAAFLLLGLHLWHGVQSSFQSAGLNHPKYFGLVKVFSKVYAILIGGGFGSLVIWAYVQGGAA
jgi:succinate dehydrogenase / fumarate reductase, cytochrome b subunit